MHLHLKSRMHTVRYTAKEFVLGMRKQLEEDYALEENYAEEGIYNPRIAD